MPNLFHYTGIAMFAVSVAQGAEIDGTVNIYALKGRERVVGTGFFIDKAGSFVTAYHVVKDSSAVEVFDKNNESYKGISLISFDADNDIAILTVNSVTGDYYRMSDQKPSVSANYKVMGSPWGIKDQTFHARPTYDGFIDSLKLVNDQGKGIYSKSFPIIPLDLTIYNGMSGAPLLNSDGDVVGMVVGSLNVGGSLAWATPSHKILELVKSSTATRVEIKNVLWKKMTSIIPQHRNFAVNSQLSIDETIDWINLKWNSKGLKRFEVDGFPAKVSSSRVEFDKNAKVLKTSVFFSLTGEEYLDEISIDLEDSLSAEAKDSYRVGSSGYFFSIECPVQRRCIHFRRLKHVKERWQELLSKRTAKIGTGSWSLVDKDSAERVAGAVNHLIHLHGAPVDHKDAF